MTTCPITQGALVRFLLRAGQSTTAAQQVLGAVVAADSHDFWPDGVSFTEVQLGGVVGHRQVTDAYLAQLARRHGGKLATLDSGLAHLHNVVALFIPTT